LAALPTVFVQLVAVGALDHQAIATVGRFGRWQQGRMGRTQVATEDDSLPFDSFSFSVTVSVTVSITATVASAVGGHIEFHIGGSEDVARSIEAQPCARQSIFIKVVPLAIGNGAGQLTNEADELLHQI